MILTLYNYNYRIPVTFNNYTGQLGNVTMFDDTLVLHKNVNNTFQLKVNDRDRVRLKIDEENPISIKFRIIDEDGVVVSSFYLVPEISGHFWEYTIPKDEINDLNDGENYKFTATLYNPDDESEKPLYVDHNFKMMGSVTVHDNYYDIITEEYTTTEPIITRYLTDETVLDGKHFFVDHIFNDGSIYKVEVRSFDESKRCSVSLDKHMQRHYPIQPKNEQWETVATYYGIGIDTTEIAFQPIPERVYARIIIHTDDPDNFELIVHRIQR